MANYDENLLTEIEEKEQQALSDVDQAYGKMIGETDSYYNSQIQASKDWAEQQSKLQQEQTDFAIEQIEQQKEQSQKDYVKEQSAAYVDWQKQSNQYGANAEQMAASGLNGSGYSESSQVSMYNTYQNRLATARESYNNAVVNYNNAIKEARLQNNSVLAEIAYATLQEQLSLALQAFEYKNQLAQAQLEQKTSIAESYNDYYLDVLEELENQGNIIIKDDADAENSEAAAQTGAGVLPAGLEVMVNAAKDQQSAASLAVQQQQIATVASTYSELKEQGYSQRELDEILNKAVELGILTQRQATEIRDGR